MAWVVAWQSLCSTILVGPPLQFVWSFPPANDFRGYYCYTDHLLALDACIPHASQRFPFQPPNSSPLQLQTLAWFLTSHLDRNFTQCICQGFSFSFRFGYNYNASTPAARWHNHPSALASHPVLSARSGVGENDWANVLSRGYSYQSK